MTCHVKSCKNVRRLLPPDSNFTFHRFPKDGERALLWLSAINRLDKTPSQLKNAFVCSIHFKNDQFYYRYGKKLLKPDAVPHLVSCLDRDKPLKQEQIIDETTARVLSVNIEKMSNTLMATIRNGSLSSTSNKTRRHPIQCGNRQQQTSESDSITRKRKFLRIEHNYSLNMSTHSVDTHFKGKQDRYKGLIIDSEEEECTDITDFCKKLDDSLKIWTENELRGIWFKVHLNQSEWVPILTKNGFKYHHAKEEYILMYKWLPKTENSNIPPFAHTMLGVGAVVINYKNQLLIVQEKYKIRDLVHYKLPGGYVEPGENIVDAAIREVHEETNIRTEFQSVLTLRHTHGSAYNCSDIYMVVHLKALTDNIIKCEREIAEAKWIDIKDFLNHPNITQLNKFFVRKYLEYKDNGIKINCFHGIHELMNKAYTMYSVTKSDIDVHEKALENVKGKI